MAFLNFKTGPIDLAAAKADDTDNPNAFHFQLPTVRLRYAAQDRNVG
jgi:hypothetical protein